MDARLDGKTVNHAYKKGCMHAAGGWELIFRRIGGIGKWTAGHSILYVYLFACPIKQ